MTVGSGPSLRDVRDGCGRCSPVLLLLADRRFPADPLWLELSRFLWEATSNLTSEVLLRDLALSSVVESPFAPSDVAILKRQLEGRLARRGHLRWQEAEDGTAGTLDWAFLSVLLNLDGDSECITLGLFVAGLLTGVGMRLPHAHWILERKVKLRGMFREATAVFVQDLWSGTLGALFEGQHDDVFPTSVYFMTARGGRT